MTASAAVEALAALRSLVEQAKGVPMTSSVLVPRGDLLSLLDRCEAAVSSPDAGQGAAPDGSVLADAHAEAERILADAQARADSLVEESEVARAARAEAQAFKHEADTWVDGRLSELETGLNRTLEQIETMRERLHQRSGPGDD